MQSLVDTFFHPWETARAGISPVTTREKHVDARQQILSALDARVAETIRSDSPSVRMTAKPYIEARGLIASLPLPPAAEEPWRKSYWDYNGFRIVVKQDFGGQPFRIDAMPCMWGYVVIYAPGAAYAGCNAMPGATWFQTVQDAKDAIDILIAVGGEKNSDEFWTVMQEHRKNVLTARQHHLAALIAARGA